MAEYVNPWTTPQHDDWVAAGHCPSIHTSKAWCNKLADIAHTVHFAPYINESGHTVMALSARWTDKEAHPKLASPETNGEQK